MAMHVMLILEQKYYPSIQYALLRLDNVAGQLGTFCVQQAAAGTDAGGGRLG